MKWVVSSLTGPSHARIVFRSTPPRGRCVGHRRGLSQDRKKRALTSTSGHLRLDDAVRRPGLCNHAIASCLDTRREVIRLWREHFFEPRSAGTVPGKAPRRAARGASSSATARTALSQRSACGRWNPEEGLAAAEGSAGRSVRNSIREASPRRWSAGEHSRRLYNVVHNCALAMALLDSAGTRSSVGRPVARFAVRDRWVL